MLYKAICLADAVVVRSRRRAWWLGRRG